MTKYSLNAGSNGIHSYSENCYLEFKKPLRTDYTKEDPIDQAYRSLERIRESHFRNEKGREITVSANDIPASISVICDKVMEINKIAVSKRIRPTTDHRSFTSTMNSTGRTLRSFLTPSSCKTPNSETGYCSTPSSLQHLIA